MPNHQTHQDKPQTSGTSTDATQSGAGQKSAAGSASSTSQKTSQEPAGTFSDKAGKAVDQVKTTAIERVEDVRNRAESGLVEQRGRIVDRINRVSDVLRVAGDQLHRDDEMVAGYIQRASQQVERAATYVDHADFGTLADDVGHFARTRPAWFIGGAFVAGLALGRFFKSSDTAARGPSSSGLGSQPLASGMGYGSQSTTYGTEATGFGTGTQSAGYMSGTPSTASTYGSTTPSTTPGTYGSTTQPQGGVQATPAGTTTTKPYTAEVTVQKTSFVNPSKKEES